MSHVGLRQRMECHIVMAIIKAALAAGYAISVDDGDDVVLSHSKDAAAITGSMMSTDNDELSFHKRQVTNKLEGSWEQIGWVRLVYGNSGYDVISDYSDNTLTAAILSEAEALATWYGDRADGSNAQEVMAQTFLEHFQRTSDGLGWLPREATTAASPAPQSPWSRPPQLPAIPLDNKGHPLLNELAAQLMQQYGMSGVMLVGAWKDPDEFGTRMGLHWPTDIVPLEAVILRHLEEDVIQQPAHQ